MSDSIRPYQNYTGGLVPQAALNGTINTIVYASNYNDLDNKPSINSVELRGNKTASDLGLATPADIMVTSVNTQTGDVSLTGQNIPYDSALSVTEKINDLESQIVDSGVSSVNGYTGIVNLTGNDIPYIVGKSVNTKINEVESSIPIVDYPVTSVNGETGAVVLSGSDIEYSEGVSLNAKINAVEGEIPVIDYPVTSVNELTGDVALTGADIPLGSDFSDPTSTAGAIKDLQDNKADTSTVGTTTSSAITANTGYTLRYSELYKRNNMVYGCCAISIDSGNITSRATIGSIPTGFRVTGGRSYVAMTPAASSINGFLNATTSLIITTGGDIIVGDYVAGTVKEVSISFCYLA